MPLPNLYPRPVQRESISTALQEVPGRRLECWLASGKTRVGVSSYPRGLAGNGRVNGAIVVVGHHCGVVDGGRGGSDDLGCAPTTMGVLQRWEFWWVGLYRARLGLSSVPATFDTNNSLMQRAGHSARVCAVQIS